MLVHGRGVSRANVGRRDGRLLVPCVSSRGGIRINRAFSMTQHAGRAMLALAALIMFVPNALAAGVSILGTWHIVEAAAAPWVKPQEQAALAAAGRRMLNTEVTFAPGTVKSKFKPLDCKNKVLYDANSIEADALFQGNLPEPNPAAAAARLGFPKGDIPGVDVRCLKALYTFHFRDPNTALINLDRVIYTLKRQ
jgi:hypothetical protein